MENILIVEDSKLFSMVLKREIEQQLPVQVTLASSMAEAKPLIITAHQYFLSLLDLNLPDAGNGEVVDLVRQYEIPIIVFSGSFDEKTRQYLQTKNVIDYIPKANRASIKQIVALIKRILTNRSTPLLVVDDSRTARHYVLQLLRRHEFPVYEASNGVEALQVLAEHPDIKLIITDYNMPQMDGFELIGQLRQQFDKQTLAIIGISTAVNKHLSAHFIKQGANDFINKPFEIEEFYCRIYQNVEMIEYFSALNEKTQELDYKNQEINAALNEVREINQTIMSSIHYAKRIQHSLLPNHHHFSQHYPENFIIWQPRDMVGGDMYFTGFFAGGCLVAVLDCTGHGIPGALLSMIAMTNLRRMLEEGYHSNPADILAYLNYVVKTTLQQDTDNTVSDDGLDAAICFISHTEKTLTFAGANLPLIYIVGNKVHFIKGDRQSIGYKRSDLDFKFTNHTITIDRRYCFYLASDGIADQRGGPQKVAFGNRRLQSLLLEYSQQLFSDQKTKILKALADYQKECPRQDDITLIGFAASPDILSGN